MNQSAETRLVMGQTEDAVPIQWDMVASPHLRVHGKSQGSGKTNLIRTVAAAALRMGHHVLVLDRRRFKDWSEFDGRAELVDVVNPARAVEAIEELTSIYQYRDRLLGQNGAPNIGRLAKPPQRIVVVISEFGALCEQAWADGMLKPLTSRLSMIMREAGATGVHVVIEDQFVDDRWPKGISTNAEPVCGYLPQNYGAAGGYYHAHKLPSYTFHYGGTTFQSFDMRHAMPDVLRPVPAMRKRVIVPRSTVPTVVDGEALPLENTPRTVENVPQNAPQNGTPGTDEPGRWVNVVDAWFAANPSALTGPAVGISDLARAMCNDAEGNTDNYEAYKGRAHKLFHEFRASVRLSTGDRLGTDISAMGD